MNQPVTPLKRWATTLGIVITILLNACVSTPYNPFPISGEKPYVGPIPNTSTNNTGYPVPNTTDTSHIVNRGETLYGIAARYGLNYKDVARWNNLPPPYAVNPGQVLVLSGPIGKTTSPPVNTTSSSYDTNTFTREEDSNTNDTDYHTVVARETLYSVAKRYGRTKAEIRTWNNLRSDNLWAGQRLRVTPPTGNSATPATTPTKTYQPQPPASPTTSAQSSGQHVVQGGDTLYSVAKLYGYTPADIAAWNDMLPPYNVAIGQILIVSPPASLSPSSYQTKSNDKEGYYTVVAGDTLFSISKRHGCTVADLKAWNSLPSEEVSVGQLLRVSAATTDMPVTFSPPSINYKKRTVRKGETLYRIATENGMTEAELAKLNGIGPPYTVFPGQELTIIPKK